MKEDHCRLKNIEVFPAKNNLPLICGIKMSFHNCRTLSTNETENCEAASTATSGTFNEKKVFTKDGKQYDGSWDFSKPEMSQCTEKMGEYPIEVIQA